MNIEELKPCPFCGSEPHLWNYHSKWYVDCEGNDCLVNPGTTNDMTKQQAIDAWNTRSNPTVAKEKHENPN